MVRKSGLLLLIFFLLALGAGCSKRPKTHLPDILRVASLSNPLTLNPLFIRDASTAEAASLLHPALIGFDRDNLLPQPRIISEWEVSNDGLIYLFTLREDVFWSDGMPLTAEDIAFTLRVICHRDYTGPLYMHMHKISGAVEYRERHDSPLADGSISGVRVIDGHSFEISLTEKFASFLTHMAISPLPFHLLGSVNAAALESHEYSRTVTVGLGPYLLNEWVQDSYLHLTANNKYFLGKPKIENLYLCIVPNQETQLIELLAGRLDLLPTSVKVEDIAKLRDDPTLAVYSHLRLAYDYLGFNMKKENSPLADKRVRQALAMTLDREEIVANLLLGFGQVAHGPLSPLQFAYNSELEGMPFNPDWAQSKILEAGFGEYELKLIYNAGNLVRENVALLFKERAAKIGVKIRITLLEWEAFLDALHKGDFDIIILGHGTGVDPDLTYYWHSKSPGNSLGYSNTEVDLLLEEGLQTGDLEERTQIYRHAEQLIVDDAPLIWLYYREAVHAATANLKYFTPHPVSLFYNVHEWSLVQ
ncbi:MAG: hypothetical protein KGZ79_08580 [Dethiobacter sp.]|nr:hypothetical protein [Dethiobacter sp.]